MPDINMPKLSDTMEEGTVVEWKKKSGDQVKAGEVLAEVESDKATFDLEAESDGVLQILVEQGVPAKIGAPIAKIGEAGAQAKSEPAPAKSEPAAAKQAPAHKGGAAEPKPKEPETPATLAEEREPAQTSSPPPESPAERPAPTREESQDGQQQGAEVRASPLARRLAEEMGVDLSSLKGSGPEGRIVKEDVIAAGGTRPKADRRRAQPAAGHAARPEGEGGEPPPMQ